MRTVLLSFLLLVSCAISHAQDCGITWKRRTSHVIDTKGACRGRSELAVKIAAAIKSEKIMAYIREDDGSMRKMDATEIPHAFKAPNDTVVVDDVAHNKTIYKIIRSVLAPDSLYHFITLEDWSFSPVGDTVKCGVAYVGVAYDVRDTKRTRDRTHEALFWVKYADVATLVHDDAEKQLQLIVSHGLWNTRFTKGSVYQYNIVFTIDMYTAGDVQEKYRADEYQDSLLSEMMVVAARDHIVPVWESMDDTALTRKMTDAEILKQTTNTDTLYDPTDSMRMGVIRTELNYNKVNRYFVGMSWSFDAERGALIVRLKKIAPILTVYDNMHLIRMQQDLFSMRYSDMLPMLKRIEERHPDNTLQIHIWNTVSVK